ncbi:hypothetical protein ACROYT_G025628 [Oculina patagonica]
MKKSFYVDDIVTGQTTSREAGELYEKAKTRLAISGFKLRKSLTNSKELKAKITKREMRGESNVDKQIESADESYAKATIGAKVKTKSEKIPGLSWNCESDTFVFELSEMVEKADGLPVPKRNILKVFAGMYDPLGFLSPVIVGMKVLSQELCVSKVDWDERITSEIEKSWIGWLRDLKETKEIHVPRCVHGIGQDLTSKWKLEDHGGVLKCRRRLENSDLDMKAQQPIILAKDHRLTKLLIEECHRKTKLVKRLCDSDGVKESNRIDWKFNLEKTPWWGGFYERLIGTAKRCLRKVLGNAKLNASELLTVLTEVEATMNSRPLTYEYDEIGAEMLTPSHLIYCRRLLSFPAEEYNNKARAGEVVLVHEDNVKRSNWKMGKVEELIVGKDKKATHLLKGRGNGSTFLASYKPPIQCIWILADANDTQ